MLVFADNTAGVLRWSGSSAEAPAPERRGGYTVDREKRRKLLEAQRQELRRKQTDDDSTEHRRTREIFEKLKAKNEEQARLEQERLALEERRAEARREQEALEARQAELDRQREVREAKERERQEQLLAQQAAAYRQRIKAEDDEILAVIVSMTKVLE